MEEHDHLQLRTRDKVVQRMTRDGAVEENLSRGTSARISQRIADADLVSPEETAQEPLTRPKVQKKGGRKKQRKRIYAEQKKAAAHATVARVTAVTSDSVHSKVGEESDDNSAVEAAHKAEGTAEDAAGNLRGRLAKHKLSHRKSTSSLTLEESDTGERSPRLKFEPECDTPSAEKSRKGFSHAQSKAQQKRRYKQEYAAARKSGSAGNTAGKTAASQGKDSVKEVLKNGVKRILAKNKGWIVAMLVAGLAGVMVLSGLGTMGSLVTGGGTSLMESSYLASDEEIYSAEEAYSALETALQTQLSTIESTYPGYDEYRYQVDEISHNPYQLASYLTVRYGAYTSDEVEPELAELFQAQYSITVESTTETTEEAEEGSESQTVTVLNVTLTNAGFDTVARNRLSEEEALNWYGLLNSAYGNRDYLWDTATYSGYTTGGISYEIPPEALEDEQFRNMITEAEKYLGYPYVWGGSSPSTSFDCSGFVSWVINNCGNGWSYGRLTANGLLGICTYVSPNEAQPGDLIFFQGTYDTTGASHVGIYVGGGAMIHCGNPIQYASVETSYWQQHFLCYGRIS